MLKALPRWPAAMRGARQRAEERVRLTATELGCGGRYRWGRGR